jgi:hypothetical protein
VDKITATQKRQLHAAAVFIASTLAQAGSRGVAYGLEHAETGECFLIRALNVCVCEECSERRKEQLEVEYDQQLLASIIDDLNAEDALNKEDAQ